MEPKYDVEVNLIGNDGNAFAIMGAVTKALRKANIPDEEINKYMEEAMAGDYDNLLRVTIKTVKVL